MITLDIETTMAMDHIWCCGLHITGEKRISVLRNPMQVMDKCSRDLSVRNQVFVGHNIVNFDAPKLKELWDLVIPDNKLRDTLLMSRLWNPRLSGGHSLGAWGERLGYSKIDFTDYDGGISEEMITYCKRDVSLTVKLEEYLTTALSKDGFSEESIQLEHDVAVITSEQESNGFKLDIDRANELLTDLMERMNALEREVQEVFPPLVEERVSEKTGKKLKDKVTVFNLGSRKQIASRLQGKGIVFKDQTEKGNIVVNEKTLASIDLPEARLIGEYLTLQKRVGQIDNWVNAVADDGRVHGRVITNGAVSGRMTHQSPNMAQVPASKHDKKTGELLWGRDSWYGTDCRACWIVDEGNVLVGLDASGLELRMLAHYMNDADYTNTILTGDIHTANQLAAGLETRNQAKVFVYAYLYGAGDEKIGAIAGGGRKKGKQLKASFLAATPALVELKANVAQAAARGYVVGLDKRKVFIRSEHAALNSLLQSAGAMVMKQALVILDDYATRWKLDYKFVGNIHDEFQVEVREDHAERFGSLAASCIEAAGIHFKLRCPLAGEFNIGNNWAETH